MTQLDTKFTKTLRNFFCILSNNWCATRN